MKQRPAAIDKPAALLTVFTLAAMLMLDFLATTVYNSKHQLPDSWQALFRPDCDLTGADLFGIH